MRSYAFIFEFITFLILISGQKTVFAQPQNIVFEHYSIDKGMYETNVTSVIQDKTGFLWFGTWSGIEKYDGYNFTAYKNDPDDTNSVDKAFVNTLYKDSEENIWIGTWWQGLDKFNYTTGIFTHYKLRPHDQKIRQNERILAICEDGNMLWIGTRNGLYKFDKNTGKFIRVPISENINSDIVNAIYKDNGGIFWFGTSNGLYRLNKKSGKFVPWWNSSNDRTSGDYYVNTIFGSKSGVLWLGTQDGIAAFNPKTFTSNRYINGKRNSISSICEDEFETLWIGTEENGLYALDEKTMEFVHFPYNAKEHSVSSKKITSIFKERSGTIWITTLEGGANKINRVKQPFKKYSFEGINRIVKGTNNKIWIGTSKGWFILYPKDEKIVPYSFGSDYLVEEEKSGDLWIGKHSGGIYKRDVNGIIKNSYTFPGQEIVKPVRCFYKEKDGTIWIGIGGGEVYKVEPNKSQIEKVFQSTGTIKCFYLDDFGIMWIGTFQGGLISFDPKKNIPIKKYFPDPKNPNSTKSYTFLEIHADKKGTLWFATDKGLCKYNRSADSLIYYNLKNGLPHDIVWSILQDDHNNIWLSTWKGVSKFDTKINKFQNYDVSYGLPENGLSNLNGCKLEDGEMYFGSTDAVIRFHPDSIKTNPFIPPVIITSVKKSDTSIPIKEKIYLTYKENFLSFEFVALNYVSPERNQYAYIMQGIDTGWVYSGTRRFASYSDLAPGKYIFRVKGSNNDGVWNEAGASVAIIISPPWWKTWWAYLFYSFCFILTLYGIRRYEMNRISYKNQLKVNQAIVHEKEETEKIKSRFFANISHEFRTPLTLILGPAEKILSNISKDVKKDAGTIKRNAQRLLQLVNQLLDLSRLEARKLNLQASKGNIVSFVKGITLSFESLAEAKDITLKLKPEREYIELYFDKENMIKILYNILSNAFKFTPEDGKITVSVKEVNNQNGTASVEIKIKDTGIGIPEDDIPKLFDRFYQVDSSLTKEYEGTGIGLALTKELVELHHGNIRVESKIGAWTEFTLSFPPGRDHLTDSEMIQHKTDTNLETVEDFSGAASGEVEKIIDTALLPLKTQIDELTSEDKIEVDENKIIILVVEDNYDMREYIKESLDSSYHIEEAINGEQGIRKAEKIIPDLVVTDMMMPKMDGLELTRILKDNEKTSHIPIILLTAKSEQLDKIEGLRKGADDYLTKPYDAKELQVRIENLIAVRKKLQQKYSGARFPSKQTEKKLRSIDEEFMRKVINVIEKHLSEEDFSIEEFSSELNMSRVQLHRKLKALAGKSAGHFLRSVRLARAKQFIEEQKGNIAEIAYLVGFSSPAYFTKCFKEEFGYLPSDLMN